MCLGRLWVAGIGPRLSGRSCMVEVSRAIVLAVSEPCHRMPLCATLRPGRRMDGRVRGLGMVHDHAGFRIAIHSARTDCGDRYSWRGGLSAFGLASLLGSAASPPLSRRIRLIGRRVRASPSNCLGASDNAMGHSRLVGCSCLRGWRYAHHQPLSFADSDRTMLLGHCSRRARVGDLGRLLPSRFHIVIGPSIVPQDPRFVVRCLCEPRIADSFYESAV